MAFSNDEKQEIKDIVLETMTEQSDAVDYTEQVVEFAPGDEVPIVRNGDGTGEKSYGRAPVSMFGGGGSSGVNGIKVGGSGQVLTPTSGVVTLPAYESGAEKNPAKYLKEAAISQDGNSLTIKDNNNETKTFTPIGGGGSSVTPSDADPLEDGTKSAGSATTYSRGDHRHPHDTTKADKSEMVITPGTGDNTDKTTIQLKNGLSTTVLTRHRTYSVMGASGQGHAAGLVPDPGATAGATKYLCENGTWDTPHVTDISSDVKIGIGSSASTVELTSYNVHRIQEIAISFQGSGYIFIAYHQDCDIQAVMSGISIPFNTRTETTIDGVEYFLIQSKESYSGSFVIGMILKY